MSWLLTNLIAAFLLPPLNLIVIALPGLLFWRKYPRFSRYLLGTAVILLWLLSTPLLAEFLLQGMESSNPALNVKNSPADAIVVLGGGSYFHAPEYARDTVSAASLQRLRYAAKLYRDSGKPILLSGGSPLKGPSSEARQMQQVLQQEFNTPVQWVEENSDNTLEAARLSYQLLLQTGIRRIYLVTHAWHMPRAALAFQTAGFEVVAAPTAFTTRYEISLLSFVPDASALRDSQIFLHETIGMLWYRLKS